MSQEVRIHSKKVILLGLILFFAIITVVLSVGIRYELTVATAEESIDNNIQSLSSGMEYA